MKRLVVAVMLLPAATFAACGGEPEPQTIESEAPVTSAAGTASDSEFPAVDPDAFFVDVRTPEEFASGHVAGAINIPHDQMEQRWEELAAHQDRPMVVYCRTGRRSGIALDVLQRHGFTEVVNGGGLEHLVAQGIPTDE